MNADIRDFICLAILVMAMFFAGVLIKGCIDQRFETPGARAAVREHNRKMVERGGGIGGLTTE